MQNNYSMITDIAFLNSNARTNDDFNKLFSDGLFSNTDTWSDFKLSSEIEGLMDNIQARMKYNMSKMSLGVYNVLEMGPEKNICNDDEIYLFSGFTEIETINKIGELIMTQDYSINPALFPNSVHHISLCYYTILKKFTNYCATVIDGLSTNLSFIDFIKNRSRLTEDFIVVSGEESSNFFNYEEDRILNIFPSFAAYKIKPNKEKGFRYYGILDSFEELEKLDIYKDAKSLFVDKETFLENKFSEDKDVFCERPLIQDNPCGILFRLAFPFYFEIKGKSLVLEKIENKIHVFEISL